MTMNVFATTNTANQGIGQSQKAIQLGVCVSGNGTLFSCNNSNSQNQANSGNNAQHNKVAVVVVAIPPTKA